MTYKNTIEIVTKDIQDIEKLVDGFKNYSSVPSIELDLALSKLRNIYDILLMLRENTTEKPAGDIIFIEDETEPEHDREVPETKHVSVKTVSEEPEIKSVEKDILKVEAKTEEERVDTDTTVEIKPDETPVSLNSEDHKEERSPITGPESTSTEMKKPPVEKQQKKSKTTETVLGDTFKDNRGYVYDRLGGQTQKPDLTSKLQSSPIKSIAGSIGINDKFYYIRELFNSNAEDFRQTITNLDNAHNFNEAYNYLIENLDWDMESEPVQQLLTLIRRKFISREDE